MRSTLGFVLTLVLIVVGCGARRRDVPDGGSDASTSDAASNGTGTFRCVGCLNDTDCGGGDECVQFGLDTACGPPCSPDGACAAGASCQLSTSVDGEQAQICVPDVGACGGSPADDGGVLADGGTLDSDAGTPAMCGGLAAPTTTSCCTSCTTSTGTRTCQANGCYGGWWCNSASCHCQTAPASCAGTGGTDGGTRDGGVVSSDAGPLPVGTVTASGGTVSRLLFGVIGDTRPPVIDDTHGYPSTIIQQIYSDLQARSPVPQFIVTTGDYCFASTAGTQAHTQIQMYMAARAAFSGPVFPAMGNHECTGHTNSNCGPSGADGMTRNYTSFLNDMLAPIGQSNPYYMIRVDATDSSWTSKIVVAAPNAWDSTQDSWFRATMAIPTTYTFVIRHEPKGTSTPPPGLTPMDSVLASAPHTLLIVGHTHTYKHARGSNEVVIGLGGAPPTGGYDYGYLVVEQNGAGDIVVTEYDYSTGASHDTFTVHADGSPG